MRRAIVAVAVLALAIPVMAKKANETVVPVKTSTGDDAGSVTFMAAKDGKLEVKFALKNLPSGPHGFHIHLNPVCDAPDFKTAGGHMGEPAMHQHENVTISPDGTTPTHFEFANLTYGGGAATDVLLHGASIVIHEKADDMTTDPTGNAGNRIACGVIPAAAAPM